MQRSAIERAAKARGDRITRWYAEKRTAKTMARPGLERLRAEARGGHLRKLYVFRLDRLSRSGIRDTFELVEELRDAGVELVTISDGFSLTGPAAEVILAVMAWAAKMERLAINERISAARERVEAAGGHWGRPLRASRDEIARIVRMRDRGQSVRAISVALKIPRTTVQRTIQRASGASPS
jgi:DNA invertase Pin-like site-specific DNA recombinase